MATLLDPVLTRIARWLAPAVAKRLAGIVAQGVQQHLDDRLAPQLQRLAADLQSRTEGLVTEARLRQAGEAVSRDLGEQIARLAEALARADLSNNPLVGSDLYLPSAVVAGSEPGAYMAASVPRTRDFLHPKFAEFAQLYGLAFVLHRKHWEWAFIHERLVGAGMLAPGRRGLGFGVGLERLPALFAGAGATIVATDRPSDDESWGDSGQYGGSRDALFYPHLIGRDLFDQRVSFEPCDMTRLPDHLSGFDFCWSSCALEHLGTLERGIEFVLASVERCLRIGGIACHTTEVNLSSDEETIVAGRDVVYRRRDLLELCRKLEARGHRVEPLRIEPGDLLPDYLVDRPPYRTNPHLKLRIGDFVSTSAALVIRRGK